MFEIGKFYRHGGPDGEVIKVLPPDQDTLLPCACTQGTLSVRLKDDFGWTEITDDEGWNAFDGLGESRFVRLPPR